MAVSAAAGSDRQPALMAVLAIAAAMVLGGGGSPAPLAEMAAQLIISLLFSFWLIWFPEIPPQRLRVALGLGGLLVVVPLVQLIPLPPALWQGLPGREVERASLDLIGKADSWRPLSLAPGRTLSALLALVPPAIVLVITGTLGPSGRALVVRTIAFVSFIAVIVGAAQAAGGGGNPLRFYPQDGGHLAGFQANHNSAADVLLIGMVAYAVAVQDWLERARRRPSGLLPAVMILSGVALLSLAVVLTASRAGTALLPVAWLAVFAATRGTWRMPLWKFVGIVSLLGALATGAYLARGNAVIASLLGRYTFSGELRPQIWADSFQVAKIYSPVGAGMGAFLPVFIAAEPLASVQTAVPNRAHNDYLELAIEAGLFGCLVLATIVTVLARLAARQLRQPSPRLRGQAIFALAALTIVALHSQVDYPLRSIALACIAAASAALLVPVAKESRGTDGILED